MEDASRLCKGTGVLDGLKEIGTAAITALSKHGPVPVAAVAIALAALGALSLGADALAVVVIALAAIGAVIYAEERKASWRRRELRAEFDEMQRTIGPRVHKRLQSRLDRKRQEEEPSLFDDNGDAA